MPMNPGVKERWIAALRDPKAVQGRGTLKNQQGGRCCLDFLNQQCSDEGYQPQPEPLIYGYWGYEDDSADLEDGYQTCLLTKACIAYAGVAEADPKVSYTNLMGTTGDFHLSYLNDVLQLSLWQIAQIIEDDETI